MAPVLSQTTALNPLSIHSEKVFGIV